MKEQEIQDTLDLFDMQFAKGEINQSTYSELTKKWQEKLQSLKGGAVVVSGGAYTPPASTPAPLKVESLECPKCHAPIKNLEQDLSKPIRCNSCGDTYTLRQSQDETQRLLQEAKIWFEQRMVSSGAGGSNSIDMNARRFIFNENLFPELKRDIDRRLGTLEDAPKAPLFPLTVMPAFQDYRPNSDLVSIGQGNNQWLKTLSTRVSAQELQVFATIEADRERLKALEFRVHTLIYYANIARFLESTGAPSYQLVQHNLQELQKECRTYAQEVADESYRSYLLALDSRISGALLLLDVLMPVFEQGRSFAPGAALEQLDRALAQYSKAAQQPCVHTLPCTPFPCNRAYRST